MINRTIEWVVLLNLSNTNPHIEQIDYKNASTDYEKYYKYRLKI